MTENERKLEIAKMERQGWENNLLLLEMRHRVQKKLDNKEAMTQIEAEMVKSHLALSELDTIEKEIVAEMKKLPKKT